QIGIRDTSEAGIIRRTDALQALVAGRLAEVGAATAHPPQRRGEGATHAPQSHPAHARPDLAAAGSVTLPGRAPPRPAPGPASPAFTGARRRVRHSSSPRRS